MERRELELSVKECFKIIIHGSRIGRKEAEVRDRQSRERKHVRGSASLDEVGEPMRWE